jgi:ATP-dependent Clp endopeptidase proteolytic subunit ClpP
MKTSFFNIIAGKNGEACILLYGNIGGWDGEIKAGDIVRELLELENTYKKIDVRINSMGGEVYAGVAIFNALRASKAAITIYIDGIAASMGSIIAFARRPVYMSKYARLMIHSVQGGAYGNTGELESAIREMGVIEDSLADIYAERIGKPKEEIKAEYFDGKDHWLTASQALAMGLVDGIYDTDPVPEDSTHEQVYNIYQNRLQTNNNQNNMLSELLKKRPSFASFATDADILNHIENLEQEAGRTTALAGEVAQLTAQLAEYEKAQKEARTAEIAALVAAAVTDGRIKEPQRAVYTNLLSVDFENGKAALEALQAPTRVADVLTGADPAPASFWDARMDEIRNKQKK